MREIRTSGSEGGVAGIPAIPTSILLNRTTHYAFGVFI